MKYSVYGRFKIEVARQDDVWQVFRISQGVKRLEPDVQIHPDTSKSELLVVLDDVFHELALPGKWIEEIDDEVGEVRSQPSPHIKT